MADVTVARTMAATPQQVWALVSDPTRMNEWSPENTGAEWVKGADGPAVGARFRGSNARGRMKWKTMCTVTRCDDLEHFAFDVATGPIPVATWGYELEPDGDGTKVTEHWTNREHPAAQWFFNKLLGVDDRAELNRTNMEATLAAMAAELER
jgi:uncharacterized protein YndB with AHSA1/START domain